MKGTQIKVFRGQLNEMNEFLAQHFVLGVQSHVVSIVTVGDYGAQSITEVVEWHVHYVINEVADAHFSGL